MRLTEITCPKCGEPWTIGLPDGLTPEDLEEIEKTCNSCVIAMLKQVSVVLLEEPATDKKRI